MPTWKKILLDGDAGPTDADYLVGTANAGLSAEIVVGTTPGGELGGTWASPTVDATHSGSAHHSAVTVTDSTTVDLTLSGQDITAAINHTHKFRATRTTDQTLTDATFTKVQFATEDYDPGSDYDNATNFNYTVPVTGYYLVTATVQLIAASGTDTTDDVLMSVFVNGTEKARGIRFPSYADVATGTLAHDVSASEEIGLVVCSILSLASTNTVDIRVYTDSSGANVAKVDGATLNDFCMHLLSV